MKQNKNFILYILMAILLAFTIYFIYTLDKNIWIYELKTDKKRPYDTYLTYELLQKKYKEKGFKTIDDTTHITLDKLTQKNETYNYIYIGNNPYYDSLDLVSLKLFIEKGNTVFIASSNFDAVFDSIFFRKDYGITSTKNYKLADDKPTKKRIFNFKNTNFETKNAYTYYERNAKDTITIYSTTYFRYFPPDETFYSPYNEISFGVEEEYEMDSVATNIDSTSTYIDEEEVIEKLDTIYTLDTTLYQQPIFLGYEINDSNKTVPNFVQLNFGKGQLIVISSTLPFTNYFTKEKQGLEFIEKVFSYLPKNQKTYWDNYANVYKIETNFTQPIDNRSSFGDSPLYFIINNQSLRWAWYLFLIGGIIYVIFNIKRKQNIIPIVEQPKNTSLKYIETIGQLYFNKEEHIDIALEMKQQFVNFLRQKYNFNLKNLDEETTQSLAIKSNIEIEKIIEIFSELKDIQNIFIIDTQKLIHINQILENFYKNCK